MNGETKQREDYVDEVAAEIWDTIRRGADKSDFDSVCDGCLEGGIDVARRNCSSSRGKPISGWPKSSRPVRARPRPRRSDRPARLSRRKCYVRRRGRVTRECAARSQQ